MHNNVQTINKNAQSVCSFTTDVNIREAALLQPLRTQMRYKCERQFTQANLNKIAREKHPSAQRHHK